MIALMIFVSYDGSDRCRKINYITELPINTGCIFPVQC